MMNEILIGDCFNQLPTLSADSVHAVVTDPPYGLAFMGRDWDTFEPKEYQEWCEEWAGLCMNVLKPGGHLLAFSGNRTHHRLFTGVEDAGFEIRDTLTWHYGSGFPKALDVSKAIDKAEGAEREVKGTYERPDGSDPRQSRQGFGNAKNTFDGGVINGEPDITAPATDAACEWDGWKTALKPATEFIVLARKPLAEGTVAENVQKFGTGALNIDGCRVDTNGESLSFGSREIGDGEKYHPQPDPDKGGEQHTEGRYPANVVFDEFTAEQLDREVGTLETGEYDLSVHADRNQQHKYGEYSGGKNRTGYFPADSGGPSRYYYTSKASRAERTLNGRIENTHPTVKPIDLMEWLVKLVTKENQVVLDPFCGTGTTCRAAKNLGREFIGIEESEKWADVARARCGLAPEDPDRLTEDGQTTL